jgi:peroxiredoxin
MKTECKSRMCPFSGALLLIIAVVAVGGLIVQAVQAKPVEVQVKPGDTMPAFTMNDIDGAEHSLEDFKGKVVVIAFSSQHCPWSKAADPAISAIAEDYKEKGVVVLSVDSHSSTPPAEIKEYAKGADLKFAILKDEGNVYADKVGATRTPEMFVLDKDHKIVFHGAFDNRKDPAETGETNYVRNAVDSVLAGSPVETAEVAAWGCTIKRKG